MKGITAPFDKLACVPIVAVNEDEDTAAWKYDVGTAREVLGVLPIPQPERMECAAERNFGAVLSGPDRGHVAPHFVARFRIVPFLPLSRAWILAHAPADQSAQVAKFNASIALPRWLSIGNL